MNKIGVDLQRDSDLNEIICEILIDYSTNKNREFCENLVNEDSSIFVIFDGRLFNFFFVLSTFVYLYLFN